MFGSRRKNRKNSARRRARAKAQASLRRLGVESMERRLMLSATIGDTPPVRVPTSETSVIWQLVSVGQNPTDGGFVELSAVDAGHGTSVAGIVGANGDKLDVIALDAQYLNADQVYSNNGQTWAIVTNGIQPVSMTLVYAPGNELPAIGGPTTSPVQAEHNTVEGGSISIGNLLTSVKQEQSVTVAEQGVAPTSNVANEFRHAGHSNVALASSIAGEWARPAVFETVGSERAINSRDDVDAGHGVSPVDEPAAIESGSKGDQTAQPAAAKIDADRTSMEEISAPSQEHEFGRRPAAGIAAATMLGEPNGSEIVRALFAGSTGVASTDGAAAPIPIDGELGASVLASEINQPRTAAFDEIGRTKSLTPVWEKSRAAAALISILALERIAELNARHVERESSDPASEKEDKRVVARWRIRNVAGLAVR